METNESQIAGWHAHAVAAERRTKTVSGALVEILGQLGVETSFGIVGGGIAPFAAAVRQSSIRLYHMRHESGAAFAAAEASFASDAPTALFVTTGPGIFNALNGLAAARWDGAKVVLISGSTSPQHRGRWGVQETSAYTMPLDVLYAQGPIFDYAVEISHPDELPEVTRRLQMGFARPQGFVAHISLPLTLQTTMVPRAPVADGRLRALDGNLEAVDECARILSQSSFAIWVGFGARHAADEIRTLAERTRAAVMCTPRGKGIFPETHPQFVGVTGAGGHEWPEHFVQARQPDYTLVLGSRLGETSSFWSPKLVPHGGFIHVDADAAVPGVGYPSARVRGIQAEIGSFVRALVQRLPRIDVSPSFEPLPPPPALTPRVEGPVRPQWLMQELQRVVVEGSDATVMTDSGNSFAWGNHLLRFSTPGRYRTSAGYGSLAHMTTAVVGAALARGNKAVAIVGDGAMLMSNEISSAVRYQARAVWLVLNDSRYGITDQAMSLQGFLPVETHLPRADFAQYAGSLGAAAARVERESDVEAALVEAMACDGPFLLDVVTDPDELSPVVARRAATLEKQGARGSASPRR